MKHKAAIFLATVFYTGYCPVAPGTAGALAGFIFILLVPAALGFSFLVFTIALFFTGVWASGEAEKTLGHDASEINIDEAAGILITFTGLGSGLSLFWMVFGFLLFRFFDIVKPGFIGKVQQLKGGWGVMMDDAAAGLCANIALRFAVLTTGLIL